MKKTKCCVPFLFYEPLFAIWSLDSSFQPPKCCQMHYQKSVKGFVRRSAILFVKNRQGIEIVQFVVSLSKKDIMDVTKGQFCSHTVRLIKKVTTFSIVLQSLNSTNLIVIHEHFKKLQKMNNLPSVLSNLIN